MGAPILRVALTGGIATGKSYCLKQLQKLGASTIDADILAREAVRPGSAGLAAVVSRFGRGMLLADGALDRTALGQLVFRDEEARRALEAIIHPEVYAALETWFASLNARAATVPVIAIADIPLVFETSKEQGFDVVVVAACGSGQQVERVMARDGLPRAEAERRVAAQMPIEEKRARADIVIDTSGAVADTDQQVLRAWRALEERSRAASAPQG